MADRVRRDGAATDPVLAAETVRLVRRWLDESASVPADKAGAQLAGLLKDPRGLPFAVGFIDGVIRPEDPAIAARNFAALGRDVPRFLPWHLRSAVRLGGAAAPIAPRIVVPLAQRALRSMVGHLIVDASDKRLGRSIAKIRRTGVRLNVNLLGEAVLGEREADRRLGGTVALLRRDDVDYVSIKVSSTVAPHSPWAFEHAVQEVVRRLTPLFEVAASARVPKFVNLDMEEYHDLDLTVAVFTAILDQPHLRGLEAGIVLQAYLPDALGAMVGLQDWAAERRAAGGAAVKVRIVKGANLPMERVDAALHGWPLATWGSKAESDTNYKRVLDYSLHPDRIENLRVGVAGHNLFDVAFAWLLAGRRGVRPGVDIEMLLGMAPQQAEVVRREVGSLLLYTPVVHPREFDVAIAYLVRRLEEGASQENFMSAVFELGDDRALFAREEQRFLASLAALDDQVPAPARTQDRREPPAPADAGFANTPDTDPSLEGNRRWGAEILARVPTCELGATVLAAHTVTTLPDLDEVLRAAVAGGAAWGALDAGERAAVLEQAAFALEVRRADLIEVMAAEAGKTLDQADPEVSEAVDFARYYAASARWLGTVDGAAFEPVPLTVVTPPWNFPVAIPAGSVLAALAAGSAVVLKPAPQAVRCSAVLAETLWAAGVPREALHLVNLDEGSLGRRLIADPRVDRVILTGAFETAELFRSFRADLPLLAETSGKNAIVVTPSADLDLAAKDVAQSAFGHAGQKCSAASLVILVGSVATSRRFRAQLVDAVTSLRVGWPADASSQVGPLIEPAAGKLLDALTSLAPGESWLVEPRSLDGTGRLWSPGVRIGVAPGSVVHRTEFFGPVLGVMTAATLAEAIELQNAVDYGLTAGLHSLDPDEVAAWVAGVRSGNLYVNRGITGAIVRRQPFGGWKKSAVGPGFKAGGPNYLVGLGRWRRTEASATSLAAPVAGLLAAVEDDGFLTRSFAGDAAAYATEFGIVRDVSALGIEHNLFRYRPVPVLVRLAEGGSDADLVRVLGAGLLAGSSLRVSSAVALPEPLAAVCARLGIAAQVQPEEAWLAAAADLPPGRIRLIGAPAGPLLAAAGGRPDLAVHDQPVTEAGRIELLPFLAEQAISITGHRFGTPNDLAARVGLAVSGG